MIRELLHAIRDRIRGRQARVTSEVKRAKQTGNGIRALSQEPPPVFAASWRQPEDKLVVISDTNQFDYRKRSQK